MKQPEQIKSHQVEMGDARLFFYRDSYLLFVNGDKNLSDPLFGRTTKKRLLGDQPRLVMVGYEFSSG